MNTLNANLVLVEVTDNDQLDTGVLVIDKSAGYGCRVGPATIDGVKVDQAGQFTGWGDFYVNYYSTGDYNICAGGGKTIVHDDAQGSLKTQLDANGAVFGVKGETFLDGSIGSRLGGLLHSGASLVIDWRTTNAMRVVDVNANCTITFVDPAGAAALTLLVGDATGGHAITWPAHVVWVDGAAPLPLAAGKRRLFWIEFLGGTYYASYSPAF